MEDEKILSDHKKEKNKLIAPFNYKMNGLNEVSWVNTIIPELIWIALIIKFSGERSGTAAAAELSKLATNIKNVEGMSFWGTMSSFKLLDEDDKGNILEVLSQDSHSIISDSLTPFTTIYPDNPLNFLIKGDYKIPLEKCIENLSSVIEEIFDKSTKLAIATQATLMYFGFLTDKFHIMRGSVLENFPEVQNYPDTELSKLIAAAIRSSTPIFISQHLEITGNKWSYYFWNRGLEISSCRIEI